MTDPRYLQIAEDLRRQIECGELPRGSKLPSDLELREKYRASRQAVRDAIKWLAATGLVTTQPGRGVIITELAEIYVTSWSLSTPDPKFAFETEVGSSKSEDHTNPRKLESTLPQVEILDTSEVPPLELQMLECTRVVSRHQQLFIDGRPWSTRTSFYPITLVERGATRLLQASDIDEGEVTYLQESGARLVGWLDRISVRPPERAEALFFSFDKDDQTSIIEKRRAGYDQAGKLIVLTVSVYRSDRNELAIAVGSLPLDLTSKLGLNLTNDSRIARY